MIKQASTSITDGVRGLAWAARAGKKRVPEELMSELRPEGCTPPEQSGEGRGAWKRPRGGRSAAGEDEGRQAMEGVGVSTVLTSGLALSLYMSMTPPTPPFMGERERRLGTGPCIRAQPGTLHCGDDSTLHLTPNVRGKCCLAEPLLFYRLQNPG